MAINLGDLTDDQLNQLNQPVEIPHPLQMEFHRFVTENHRIALEGIEKLENEQLDNLSYEEWDGSRDPYFDELRMAAHSLAIVAVVTRLDHWVNFYCEKLKVKASQQKKKSKIVAGIEVLKSKLGDGPVDISFFEDLISARDCFIHGDLKSEWDNKRRKLAKKYANPYFKRLELEPNHVTEAVEKTVKQLVWFDDQS